MKKITNFLLIVSLLSLANASNENECNGGKASACFSVAKEYDNQNNTDKAIEFYKKACELNYAIGCNKVGEKYLNLKKNEYAKIFFSKACVLNHHESCVSYGEIFEDEGNCDMASEIYKDTFKNKKFKPAQSKFEALVANEKCMSQEMKKQKEDGEKAKAEVENAKDEIEKAKDEIESAKAEIEKAKADVEKAKAELENSKKELEAAGRQKQTIKAMSTSDLLKTIFSADMFDADIEHIEKFTGKPIKEGKAEDSDYKIYRVGSAKCEIGVNFKNNKVYQIALVPSSKCTFDLYNISSTFGHISANKLTVGYLFDRFTPQGLIYESTNCGSKKAGSTKNDYIYAVSPSAKSIWLHVFMMHSGGADKILNCSKLTYGIDFFPGYYGYIFDQKYNQYVGKKLRNKRPTHIRVGYIDKFSKLKGEI